ncbi:hypothetical protein JSY36_03425 [Bacillus sp. H-16]|uniref:hypothetical protein n=1 Tax=Alteribacter salitolerans TaxID=2912333 RepID=UPI001963E64C|nr:hypothetical protein [Alteribacter salitolerans]MBM7094798.1 hypothetical protein [Alteribacter salitolerans]
MDSSKKKFFFFSLEFLSVGTVLVLPVILPRRFPLLYFSDNGAREGRMLNWTTTPTCG